MTSTAAWIWPPLKCSLIAFPVVTLSYGTWLNTRIDREYWMNPPAAPPPPKHQKPPSKVVYKDGTKLDYEAKPEMAALFAKAGEEKLFLDTQAKESIEEEIGSGTSLTRDIINSKWIPGDTAEDNATMLRSKYHALTGTLPAQEWDTVKRGLRCGDIILMQGNSFMSWAIGYAQFLHSVWLPGSLRYSHIALVIGPIPDEDEFEDAPTIVGAMDDEAKKQNTINGSADNKGITGWLFGRGVKEARAAAAVVRHDHGGQDASPLVQKLRHLVYSYGTFHKDLIQKGLEKPFENPSVEPLFEAKTRAAIEEEQLANSGCKELPKSAKQTITADNGTEPIIFEAIDNTDTLFTSPIDGKVHQRQTTIDYAVDRIFAKVGKNWSYRRAAVRRLEGVKWNKERRDAAIKFIEENLERPTDISYFLPMAFYNTDLYVRKVPDSVCCSEILVDFYKAIGVIASEEEAQGEENRRNADASTKRNFNHRGVLIDKDIDFDTKFARLAVKKVLRDGDTGIDFKAVPSIQVAPYHFTADFETHTRRQKSQTGVNHFNPGHVLHDMDASGLHRLQFLDRGARFGPEEFIAMDKVPSWHRNCPPGGSEEYHQGKYSYLNPLNW